MTGLGKIILCILIMSFFFFIGWFAKDPSILRRVGHILLQLPYADTRQPRSIMIADDCFELSKIPASRLTQVVIKSVEKLLGSMFLLLGHV